MARGWESKSVEAQIDAAVARGAANKNKNADSSQLQLIRKKENLLLSRTRVVRELETAQNPRYQDILHKALAVLDSQLASLAE
jgi:molecular chaperone GrpE (heat shock protein)